MESYFSPQVFHELWRFSDNFSEIYVQPPIKGEPYRRITPAALARNAPPQSGLRPAGSTFLGGCQKSMSLRTSDRRHWCGSPPVGWKQLGFTAKMFENPGDCARRKYPWGTTPACALVRNDRAFSNSPLTPFAARRTARRGSFFNLPLRGRGTAAAVEEGRSTREWPIIYDRLRS